MPALLEAWQRTLAAAPGATALIDATTERVWTRRQIDDAATAWASGHGGSLAKRTVAFAESNGAGWMTVFIGLLKCDGVAAPLDPGEPAPARRATAKTMRAAGLWSGGVLETVCQRAPAARDGRRLIKLTSGSTGAPRRLRFTDDQLLADGRQICAAMDVRPYDLNLGLIPWGHSYGLGNLVVPLLLQGTPILCGMAPLPHAIAAAAARWKPTVFPAVPALLRALVAAAVEPAELASLRVVISAGAPLATDVAGAFRDRFGQKIHSFYGSSETGGITYDATGDSAAGGRGVGQPLPGVGLEFQRGNRFVVRSNAVFTLGNPRPGAHRMPDLARLGPDGELVLLGRAGRFVKIAGRRLNLAEIEQAIRQLPGVRDAFVALHAQREDVLAAAVAGNSTAALLNDALRSRVASWKIPRKWVLLSEFPVTARGKTDTRRLRELLAARE